jgi:hypothetical protein
MMNLENEPGQGLWDRMTGALAPLLSDESLCIIIQVSSEVA